MLDLLRSLIGILVLGLLEMLFWVGLVFLAGWLVWTFLGGEMLFYCLLCVVAESMARRK